MNKAAFKKVLCLIFCAGLLIVILAGAGNGDTTKPKGIVITNPKAGQTLIEDKVKVEWHLTGLDKTSADRLIVKYDGQEAFQVQYKNAGQMINLPKRMKEGAHVVELVLTMADKSQWKDSVSFRYEKPMEEQLVTVPAGKFMMGCSPGDSACEADEKPRHEVMVSAFKMSRTEVTNWQYQHCVDAERCTPSYYHRQFFWTGPNHPVVAIPWKDAQGYCEFKGGRLPTEAEWEYAARAGSESKHYGPLDQVAWHHGNSNARTHRVALKQPNSFGLYDMLGNVWEWCEDYYHPGFYKQSPKENPVNDRFASERVLRGGGWYFDSEHVRVSNRDHVMDAELGSNGGFRCVWPVEP